MKTKLLLLSLFAAWSVTAGTIFNYPAEYNLDPADVLNLSVAAPGTENFKTIAGADFLGSLEFNLGVGRINTNVIRLADANFQGVAYGPPPYYYGNGWNFSGTYTFLGYLTNVDSSLSPAWACTNTWTNSSGAFPCVSWLVYGPIVDLNYLPYPYYENQWAIVTNEAYASTADILACNGSVGAAMGFSSIATNSLWTMSINSGTFSGLLTWRALIRSSFLVTNLAIPGNDIVSITPSQIVPPLATQIQTNLVTAGTPTNMATVLLAGTPIILENQYNPQFVPGGVAGYAAQFQFESLSSTYQLNSMVPGWNPYFNAQVNPALTNFTIPFHMLCASNFTALNFNVDLQFNTNNTVKTSAIKPGYVITSNNVVFTGDFASNNWYQFNFNFTVPYAFLTNGSGPMCLGVYNNCSTNVYTYAP